MDVIKKIVKKDFEFLFFLLLLTTIVYATSWSGEFLSDDIAGIQNNPNLGNFTQQLKTLNFNNILNSLIYKTFGLKPFWFHLINTAIHVATVIVVYVLTTSLFQKVHLFEFKRMDFYIKWFPRLTAIFFAIHPIETEGVTWISGLPYAAYTLFFLLGLLFFTLALNPALNKGSALDKIVVSTFFFILALSSSEKAVVFPVILVVYVFLFSRFNKKNLLFLLLSVTIAGFYTLARIADIGGRARYVASPTGEEGIVVFNPLIQIPIAIYSYLKLLLFPINLSLYHELVAFPQWEYYLAVTVLVLLLLSTLYLLWKSKVSTNEPRGPSNETKFFVKLVVFGLLFFLISLTPTLLPINIAWIVAERYVHLGSVGVFLVFACVLSFLIKARPFKFKRPGLKIITLLVIIYTPLTIKRNLEWRSQDTLWPATVRESPYSAYAWNNMGDYYGRHGEIENSIKSFERARQLRPRYADATHNLGNTYLQIGEATKAAELFQEALEYNPTLYQSYQNLGKIAFAQGNYVAADTSLTNQSVVAQLAEPNNGRGAHQGGPLRSAEHYFLRSAKLNPDPLADYLYLYMTYTKANDSDKAQEAFLTARRLAGANPQRQQLIQQVVSQQ